MKKNNLKTQKFMNWKQIFSGSKKEGRQERYQ